MMTAKEIRENEDAAVSKIMENLDDGGTDLEKAMSTAFVISRMLAEIAAQLAEANARSGVFEFQGEVYARSAVFSVSAPWNRSHGDCIFEVEFDRSVGSRRRTFTEAPGATREDFVRLWKGE